MSSATDSATASWTCGRCGVTVRYLPGHDPEGPPTGWSVDGDDAHCLACGRERAAENAYQRADPGMSREDRAKLMARGRIDFEIERDPQRTNGEIARALRCSVPAVLKARRQLEAASGRPVT
jgi:hypothetical protein